MMSASIAFGHTTAAPPALFLRSLVLLLGLCTLEARAQNPGRVVALLAIDTESHIASIEGDGRAMTSVLRGGFGNSGILDMKVISRDELRPDVIVDYFRRVPSGPNDVLLRQPRSLWSLAT
jgi:hypothetical protein